MGKLAVLSLLLCPSLFAWEVGDLNRRHHGSGIIDHPGREERCYVHISEAWQDEAGVVRARAFTDVSFNIFDLVSQGRRRLVGEVVEKNGGREVLDITLEEVKGPVSYRLTKYDTFLGMSTEESVTCRLMKPLFCLDGVSRQLEHICF